MSKTCNICHETKPIESFGIGKRYKHGIRPNCKECLNTNAQIKRKENPEVNRKYWERYRKSEKGKALNRKKLTKRRQVLDRHYVKEVLKKCGIPEEIITKELIEVKRMIIKTKRLCKTLQS